MLYLTVRLRSGLLFKTYFQIRYEGTDINAAKKPVYFNHDGGVDDLVSLFLLLQMESVDLIGVSVIDADCYVEPAVSASRKIIDRYGAPELKGLEVSRSNSRPKNPFPKEWRMHAFYVDALPLLNERAEVVTKEADKLAHLDLIEKVHASKEPVTLLFTGPLTDLARALDEDATIESNIEKLYWMGGTFLPDGNVHEPEHDGTAEWNSTGIQRLPSAYGTAASRLKWSRWRAQTRFR